MTDTREWQDISTEMGNFYPTPCPKCDGYGAVGYTVTVYDPGCAFPRQDTEEIPCPECGGDGNVLVEYQPAAPAPQEKG